jgi:RNA polymerase sigma factor (sigma-70 family)
MSEITAQALSELVDRHFAPLVLFARQWCRTPEDVVQEAFVRLLRQSTMPANVVGWLYRAVRNEALAAARAAQRRGRREASVAHRGEPWFERSPGAPIEAAEATARLEQLPLQQREVIVARLWGGLSLAEIAELTGSPVSTVHWRYRSGLAALRESLGETCRPKKSET